MSGAVLAALRKRHSAPAWAFLEEVRDKAGFDATRSADALAMSLWKSRGLELHGFEIKTSRSDWIRERDNPEKAEAISKFCDRWWLAVQSPEIVLDGELPPSWGLLVLHGKVLKTVREAEKRTPEPLPRTFLATMLKRATANADGLVPREELAEKVDAEVKARLASEIQRAGLDLDHYKARAELLDRVCVALGVDVRDWAIPNIAKAYHLVHSHHAREHYRGELERARQSAQVAVRGAEFALAELAGLDATARKDVA